MHGHGVRKTFAGLPCPASAQWVSSGSIVPLRWFRACCAGKATLTTHPGLPEILDVSGPGAYSLPLTPTKYLPLGLPSGKHRLTKNRRGTRPQRAESWYHWAQMVFQVAKKMRKGLASPLVLMAGPQKGGICPEWVPILVL